MNENHLAQHPRDLHIMDDLALIIEAVSDVESLLQFLENAAALVGVYCNVGKTEHITNSVDPPGVKSISGACIKRVQDFKYLRTYIMGSQKYIKMC